MQAAGELEGLSIFFHGWHVEAIQLGPRSAEAAVSCHASSSHRVLRLRAGSALVVRGTVQEERCCALLADSSQPVLRLFGENLQSNVLMMAGPVSRMDLFISAGASLVALIADSPASMAQGTWRVCASVETNAATLVGYMRGAEYEGPIESSLASHLQKVIAASSILELERGTRSARVSAVVRACRLIEEDFPSSLSLRDLSRRSGVAERTLEYGFKHVYGTTPLTFVRSQRLTRSRLALLTSKRRTSISETARQFGFRHMGQYCRDYRRLFGETPSMTLARRHPP